jgi:hypothetical protein
MRIRQESSRHSYLMPDGPRSLPTRPHHFKREAFHPLGAPLLDALLDPGCNPLRHTCKARNHDLRTAWAPCFSAVEFPGRAAGGSPGDGSE